MSRNEKRKLERWLAKQPKDTRKLVDVIRLEDTEKGQVPIFAFMTYGWTFPLYWSQQGKIKSGISNNPSDNGSIRMKQACSQKTPIAEQPRVIKELKQVWEIPMEIVGLDKSKANRIRNRFDQECNKRLSKYKVKDGTAPLVGEEWYREISINDIKKLRLEVWNELLVEYGTKLIEKEYKKLNPKGLQKPAIKAIIEALKNEVSRFKGIAPTGFGKTVVAFLAIVKANNLGLLKNRVVMMTAPNQFLANKNAASFDEYGRCNGVKNLVNIPVFSGSDLGFLEDNIAVLERKDKLANIISAYLNDNPDNVIVLHTCNPSVELVDEVLDMIGINEIDFAICDEAHTLASTYDSRWNYILEDHKVKINSRFFLTATEKTLSNPEFLDRMPNRGERVAKFNYMNNKDIFGDYAFKFSFAQGVDAEHIVPMIAKVFEYSTGNADVKNMLEFVDSLDIPELESVTDKDGIPYLFDKKLARTIVSILSIFGKEKRNKLLTICSRNTHVELLIRVIKAIQDSGKYLQDIEVTGIRACDHVPAARQDILDDINDSDKKQIVITGPWAITGVDCPSIDAVHWNFTPGTEISVTQGTGRGARLADGKKNVLVSFNLELENPFWVLRSKISTTVGKLYDAQFPSHDVELRERVRRRVGRTFARVENDNSGTIEDSLRISLDQIYEAANGVNLKQFIDTFRNRSTEDEIEILAEEFRTQYNPNLLYIKEELNKEVLNSKTFKNLINIKLTNIVVDKVFEKVNSEYSIIGRYSGYVEQSDSIIESVVTKLANKHKINFLGVKLVDINLIYDGLEKELNKKLYNSRILKTNLRKAKIFAKTCIKLDNVLIPVIGGKRTEAKDILRPALFAEAKNRCGLDTIFRYVDFKKCIADILNDTKFTFISTAFGDRTMQAEWRVYLNSNLTKEEFKDLQYASALITKREKYGEDLSGVKQVEWTGEMRNAASARLSEQNKNGQAKLAANAGNNIYVECPDGFITTKASSRIYCKKRGLKIEDCKIIAK